MKNPNPLGDLGSKCIGKDVANIFIINIKE